MFNQILLFHNVKTIQLVLWTLSQSVILLKYAAYSNSQTCLHNQSCYVFQYPLQRIVALA